MILLTSAAYVDPELQSEFGRLPPAFLPVGNQRLFQRQADMLRTTFPGEPIYLSLPESYTIARRDADTLARLDVQVVKVPDGLSLAASVLYAINRIGDYSAGVRILHGDTLVSGFDTAWDCVAMAQSSDDYNWYVESHSGVVPSIWCGYFAFGSIGLLTKCLAGAHNAFEKAVNDYDAAQALLRIRPSHWLDFGHVNTFYRSRARMTTQRVFNDLRIQNHRVHKTGTPPAKIQAEALWFDALPPALRIYVPQLLARHLEGGKASYELEYLCLAPLNELYVHGLNSPGFWHRLFRHLADWFQASQQAMDWRQVDIESVRADVNGMLADKTRERLGQYLAAVGLNDANPTSLNGVPLPPLAAIVERCLAEAAKVPVVLGVLHGDLCFSNILFDTRSDQIKLIDPRGLNYKGEQRLYGDLRYDLAKLAHSVIGLYDYLIADAFSIDDGLGLDFALQIHADDNVEVIGTHFLDQRMLDGITPRQILPITVLLFLSMLPLHSDTPQRQRAMLANALRLYRLLES